MSEVPVITVDGPGATGKGTVCSALAKHLGWHLLDSGALYRLLALAALDKGIAAEDESAFRALAAGLEVEFAAGERGAAPRVMLAGREVGAAIRSEECGKLASRLAAWPAVRAALLSVQRDFRKGPGLVADGRDMGTVVFPQAPLKIYLSADRKARAARRYKQLKAKGMSAKLAQLAADIAERDARDRVRKAAPLKAAADAVLIDTTHLSIAAVNEQIKELARAKFPGS